MVSKQQDQPQIQDGSSHTLTIPCLQGIYSDFIPIHLFLVPNIIVFFQFNPYLLMVPIKSLNWLIIYKAYMTSSLVTKNNNF